MVGFPRSIRSVPADPGRFRRRFRPILGAETHSVHLDQPRVQSSESEARIPRPPCSIQVGIHFL